MTTCQECGFTYGALPTAAIAIASALEDDAEEIVVHQLADIHRVMGSG